MCTDIIVPSPGNPQSLNRYTYTYNNPLRYVDPSGHISFEGMGIVVYDNPSYLSDADRQALLEHNTAAGAAGAAMEYVHESGGGGGGEGGGGDPWSGQSVVDLQRYGVEPSYLPEAARQELYQHNTLVFEGAPASPSADIYPGDITTSQTPGQAAKVNAALTALRGSGPEGNKVFHSIVDYGRTVQFGGMEPIRNGDNSVGWNNRIYLAPVLVNEPAEVVAAFIAHEAVHAERSVPRYPFSRSEEVVAFRQEAKVWEELRVSYKPNATGNPNSKPMLDAILAASKVSSKEPGNLASYVANQPLYKSWFYRD